MVTFTLVAYPAWRWFRTLVQLGNWRRQPFDDQALRFQKMMGCGKNFGLVPDLTAVAFLAVWDSAEAANDFFMTDLWQQWLGGPKEVGTLYLQPTRTQGFWDAKAPFLVPPVPPDPGLPIAVLTRATIRLGALVDFWRHVPQVRRRLQIQSDQLLLALGVGEMPLFQQCTLSVWKTQKAIDEFAYRQTDHREIIRYTRERKWYREELFTRFVVVRSEGTFFGKPMDFII